jgi:hypothetical protein
MTAAVGIEPGMSRTFSMIARELTERTGRQGIRAR